jgi:hypothetical protein
MSTSSPSEEARRYAEALIPFRIALQEWDRLLDAHPQACDCKLCMELYPIWFVCDQLYGCFNSGAPAAALRLVDEELGDDDDDDDTVVQPEATPAAQEAKAPRGGYF